MPSKRRNSSFVDRRSRRLEVGWDFGGWEIESIEMLDAEPVV